MKLKLNFILQIIICVGALSTTQAFADPSIYTPHGEIESAEQNPTHLHQDDELALACFEFSAGLVPPATPTASELCGQHGTAIGSVSCSWNTSSTPWQPLEDVPVCSCTTTTYYGTCSVTCKAIGPNGPYAFTAASNISWTKVLCGPTENRGGGFLVAQSQN